MAIIAGADGCRGDAWISVTKDTITGAISSKWFPTANALVFQDPTPDILMIDIPIGLTESDGRICDNMARALLRHRHVCVFSAPIRPILHMTTRQQASQSAYEINRRRVGCQAWAIIPKIRAVDAIIAAQPLLQNRVFEVHPELSFLEWNGGEPITQRKKSRLGRAIRQQLIGANLFANVRQSYPVSQVGHDDIADAFAALWTAERKFRAQAIVLPTDPPIDRLGVRMEIWR